MQCFSVKFLHSTLRVFSVFCPSTLFFALFHYRFRLHYPNSCCSIVFVYTSHLIVSVLLWLYYNTYYIIIVSGYITLLFLYYVVYLSHSHDTRLLA